MKTVLFLDKSEEGLWRTFQQYGYLVEEWMSNGSFALCPWNSGGRSVAEALPSLQTALGTEKRWRAVVVTDLRSCEQPEGPDCHFDNPFDFADSYETSMADEFAESEQPLVRLTQMLGGLPERVAVEWREEGDRVVAQPLDECSIKYSNAANKYELLERYRLGFPRPERVVCVTLRDVDEELDDARRLDFEKERDAYTQRYRELVGEHEAALERTWEGQAEGTTDPYELEQELLRYRNEELRPALNFCERNGYPPLARFVVFNCCAPCAPAPDASDASPVGEGAVRELGRSYWFEFWMGVLTLLVAEVPPENFKAYTLYEMTLSVDEGALADLFGNRRGQWLAACREIDGQIAKKKGLLRPSEFVMPALLDTKVRIPVLFDLVKSDRLYVDPSLVGLMKDKPQRDVGVWRGQRQKALAEYRELLYAPKRALRMAALSFRRQRSFAPGELDACALNSTQRELLEDEAFALERDLAKGAASDAFSYESCEDEFNKADEDIRDEICKRPTERQVSALMALTLVALLAGFAPYVVGATGGRGISLPALVVTFAVCLCVGAVAYAALVYMMNKLKQRYVEFNEIMRKAVKRLREQANDLGDRLSGYASFGRKWDILERQRHLEVPTQEVIRLEECEARLRGRVDDVELVASNCGVSLGSGTQCPDVPWSVLELLLREESFYRICDDGIGAARCKKSDAGSVESVPYAFISQVSLKPLRIIV